MIGIIGGTALLEEELFEQAEQRTVVTDYGDIDALVGKDYTFVQRHGRGVPPHKVNHKANIAALETVGVAGIIGISSVGSLRKELAPGSIVVIDDFMQLSGLQTYFEDEIRFTTPVISDKLRKAIAQSARKAKLGIIERGVYAQTQGPRLETKAEVKMLRQFADVVGMTVGNEATLACEKAIPYACICTVDNYAHGVTNVAPDWSFISKMQKKNICMVAGLIEEVLKHEHTG